ncbi:adult-specific rigid cuticular protein 15.7-like [Uloborus diversus]|uniref:adult-specific rigid cuticular protein 15.7-like n=1 Tax=Uloborus diversus TaxID=327109 RepID=UPI0024099BDC|nr:adult-specific rigid cuticular protein 15.7-like [Uloborus diversus]
MAFVVILLAVVVAVQSQIIQPIRDYRVPQYYDESPKPYSFSYTAINEDGVGQSSRTETADGTGKVEGSYTLTNDEGHTRIVDYIADQDGFRAAIRTNEPGTDNKNPADVVIESAGPYSDRPLQYGPPVLNALRRPVQPLVVDPVAPVVEPVPVVPDNALPPVRRPFYRQPSVYANRNLAYRPANRYAYNRYPY